MGEIYDGAFQAIRTNPSTMIGISAVVVAVTTIITTLPQAAALTTFFDNAIFDPATSPQDVAVEDIIGSFSGLLASFLVPAFISSIAFTVLSGLLIVAVSSAVLGRKTAPGALWQRTRSRVVALVALSLLISLIIGAVFVGAVVPGVLVAVAGSEAAGAGLIVLGVLCAVPVSIWLWTRWSLASPAMLLEGQPILAAMRRSVIVVRGSFWRTFGILLLTGIIVSVASGLVSVPFTLVSSLVSLGSDRPYDSFGVTLAQLSIQGIGTILAGAILYPFQAAVTALLYVDLRMRKEGLDLELIRASEQGSAA